MVCGSSITVVSGGGLDPPRRNKSTTFCPVLDNAATRPLTVENFGWLMVCVERGKRSRSLPSNHVHVPPLFHAGLGEDIASGASRVQSGPPKEQKRQSASATEDCEVWSGPTQKFPVLAWFFSAPTRKNKKCSPPTQHTKIPAYPQKRDRRHIQVPARTGLAAGGFFSIFSGPAIKYTQRTERKIKNPIRTGMLSDVSHHDDVILKL